MSLCVAHNALTSYVMCSAGNALALLSLLSFMSASDRRHDLKIVAALFGFAIALAGVDVAAQHLFLECADRAPAFSKVCK